MARLDLDTGLLTFSNAGHNFPLLINSDGRVKRLLNVNNRLGDKKDCEFTENSISLKLGDVLLFYTDGLIENENGHEKIWGESKLRRSLKKYYHLPVKEMVHQIVQKAYSFYDRHPLSDDITMVALRVTKPFPNQLSLKKVEKSEGIGT